MNKKITFVLGSLVRGGAERVVSILANHYAEKNWDVDILLLLDSKIEYNLNSKIKVYYIGDEKKSRYSQVPIWIKGIRNYIKQNQPNTILSFVARINIITYLANIGANNNLVVSERNDPAKDGRSKWIELATNYVYTRVNKVVFQTHQAQSFFNKKIINNSVIIYNPVDMQLKLEKYKESKKIISVGRLESQKNHKMLIKAFKNVHDKYPEYSLYIYGEGSLRSKLEKLVQDLGIEKSVFLPGVVENIHEKMLEGEMFVLSSDYEGLSNALLEALTMGLPSISTNCAGSNEIIEHCENGLLVQIDSEKAMSDAIIQLIEDKKLAEKLGNKAAKKSKSFSSDNILKEWEDILENYNEKKVKKESEYST